MHQKSFISEDLNEGDLLEATLEATKAQDKKGSDKTKPLSTASENLFKFAQAVLTKNSGKRVNDADIGGLVGLSASDCSHWKKGERSLKSIFSLRTLGEKINVDFSLIEDLSFGYANVDEALFAHSEGQKLDELLRKMRALADLEKIIAPIRAFVADLHTKAQFFTTPFYLPEILRFLPFISLAPAEMHDRLSRILKAKPGQYIIQHSREEVRAAGRFSIAKDISRILFEKERHRYKGSLPDQGADLRELEEAIFAAELLAPLAMIQKEVRGIDPRLNAPNELARMFWVPRPVLNFQLAQLLMVPSREADRPLSGSRYDDLVESLAV